MAERFSRRDAMRWAGGAAMATTFLPVAGKYGAWAHPVEKPLATRLLGRTGREVTTFGLAGGNKVQWELPGDEAVQIVVKAVRAGMTYIETANNYFLSQEKMGKAFEALNLKPGLPGYDHSLRGRLFIATKTALRHAIVRDGSKPMGRSSGGGTLVLDDIKRFPDSILRGRRGPYPRGSVLGLDASPPHRQQGGGRRRLRGPRHPRGQVASAHRGDRLPARLPRRHQPDRPQPAAPQMDPAHRHHRPREPGGPHVRHPARHAEHPRHPARRGQS